MKLKTTMTSAISLLLLASSNVSMAANIDASTSKQLVKQYQQQSSNSFKQFLSALATQPAYNLNNTIVAYQQVRAMTAEQQQQVFRLLGIYAQLKYGTEAIETLRSLVAIPTFKADGVPSHQSPAMRQLGVVLKTIATDFGLEFSNVDDRVFVVNIPNNTKGANIALHAHADVVQVNPSSWVLDDGTQLDPFKLTQIGDRLYGRGAEDDKNGIVTVLYAMRVIKEEGIPLVNQFKLLVDTTEETTSDAIPYYLESHPTPDFNLALDGGYPVVIAEKGYGTLMSSFPVRAADAKGVVLTSLTGGLATNQIPAKSIVMIKAPKGSDSLKLKQTIDQLAKAFVAKNGNNFSISSSVKGDNIEIITQGVSAHSSEPGSGVNPVSRMLMFIHSNKQALGLSDNHITDAAKYIAENFGLDYFGKTLDIAYQHDFMGPLTMALTFVDINDQQLRMAVNLRAPVGKEPSKIQAEVKAKLDSWLQNSGINMSYTHDQRAPMYRNPEGKWVNALLDVATENLNMPREFQSSAGGTSIHDLPNGVQFGLAMPNEKYTGHNANEFKRVDQFMLDIRIITEMMARLGSMQDL